jgi:hypothetical protein
MRRKTRNKAVLTGYNSGGALVFEQVLALADYWEELRPLIDEDRFGKEKSIRKLVGTLYGERGQVLQEFENTYDETGRYQAGQARHEDGTGTKLPGR